MPTKESEHPNQPTQHRARKDSARSAESKTKNRKSTGAGTRQLSAVPSLKRNRTKAEKLRDVLSSEAKLITAVDCVYIFDVVINFLVSYYHATFKVATASRDEVFTCMWLC